MIKLFDENILKINDLYTVLSSGLLENLGEELLKYPENGLLKTSREDWDKTISVFKSEFENGEPCKETITFDKSDLNLKNAEHFYITGFDMPCWVSDENSDKKIMILASEPLRGEESFDNSKIDKYTKISLNTPFSYHICNIEKNRQEKFRYWILIDWMVSQLKATVYMTDIRKFWFAGWEHYKSFCDSKIHINILKKELDFVNPDLIIIFGSRPLNILQNSNLLDANIDLINKALSESDFNLHYKGKKEEEIKYKVLPLIHPSGAACGPRKKFFEKNNVYQEGLDQNEMYTEIIKRFVK